MIGKRRNKKSVALQELVFRQDKYIEALEKEVAAAQKVIDDQRKLIANQDQQIACLKDIDQKSQGIIKALEERCEKYDQLNTVSEKLIFVYREITGENDAALPKLPRIKS